MWDALRGRRFMKLKFRRQEEIGYYIADFCCHEVRLIIELDGALHMHPLIQKEDARRTRYLQRRGYTVTRIENEELLENPAVVFNRLRRLVDALRELPHP
jgi:very-short-patch-repair endonuclease